MMKCFYGGIYCCFVLRAENEEGLSSANHTASSSSVSSQRRNAIDVLDHEMLPERKPKKSSGWLVTLMIFCLFSTGTKTHFKTTFICSTVVPFYCCYSCGICILFWDHYRLIGCFVRNFRILISKLLLLL